MLPKKYGKIAISSRSGGVTIITSIGQVILTKLNSPNDEIKLQNGGLKGVFFRLFSPWTSQVLCSGNVLNLHPSYENPDKKPQFFIFGCGRGLKMVKFRQILCNFVIQRWLHVVTKLSDGVIISSPAQTSPKKGLDVGIGPKKPCQYLGPDFRQLSTGKKQHVTFRIFGGKKCFIPKR